MLDPEAPTLRESEKTEDTRVLRTDVVMPVLFSNILCVKTTYI